MIIEILKHLIQWEAKSNQYPSTTIWIQNPDTVPKKHRTVKQT